MRPCIGVKKIQEDQRLKTNGNTFVEKKKKIHYTVILYIPEERKSDDYWKNIYLSHFDLGKCHMSHINITMIAQLELLK